jgi:hypothetical protein
MLKSLTPHDETPKLFANWDVQSKELRIQFADLTDEDLALEEGKESELIIRVSVRLNLKHEEVIILFKKTQAGLK